MARIETVRGMPATAMKEQETEIIRIICLTDNNFIHYRSKSWVKFSSNSTFKYNSEDDFRSGCRNGSVQQQFFPAELPWPHSDDQAIRTTKVESVKIVELLILEADVFVVMCCV